MYSLVIYIFLGLIIATIAKALMPGREPGVGITILLGTVAQIVAWFGTKAIGWDKFGQPWLFFLSIAAAAALLFIYRESGLDETLAERTSASAAEARAEQIEMARHPYEGPSIWLRIARAPAWAGLGAVMLGLTGFLIGFFGPMHFQPWANQGPMVGIFVTGPGGVVLGAIAGTALSIARPEWPMRRRLWTLNVANVAWGLFVLDLVADRSWWH
jgi:uncharacterized membrane protein YeaQ/YmgE (transglycosylase-associated protein family)